jgi:hypothetical protein
MKIRFQKTPKEKRQRRRQPEERSELVAVRFTPTELHALDAIAAEIGITRSECLRRVLRMLLVAGRVPTAEGN